MHAHVMNSVSPYMCYCIIILQLKWPLNCSIFTYWHTVHIHIAGHGSFPVSSLKLVTKFIKIWYASLHLRLLQMLILYQSTTDHQSLQCLDYGLDVQGWRPSRGSKLYPCHNSQTGSKTHLASYPVGTGGSFCWGMRFTTHSSLVLTLMLYEAVCPLPHTSS